jgi:hypothetical protein
VQNWSDLWLRVVAAVAVALAVGCGSGGSADDGGDDGDDTVADDAADDAADDTGDDGGDDAPVDAVPVDPTPYCSWSCSTPADCAFGEPGTISDVDNYDCVDGVCKPLGCNSTAECIETFDNPNYACATAFGTIIQTCWMTCDVAADCVYVTGNALFDVDNYACTDGMCNWTGCNSNAECASGSPTSPVCAMGPHWTAPSCVGACDVPADCALDAPAFDADNYACDDGACIYEGCNTTAECLASNPDTVCAPYPR